MIDRVLAEPDRARRLRPRQWQALDRHLRADAAVRAHDRERARRRPEPEPVVCSACGAALAEVRAGGSAWCPRCRVWSGGPAGAGVVR